MMANQRQATTHLTVITDFASMIFAFIFGVSENSNTIPLISAIADSLAAAAAIVGLGFISWQIARARQAFDLQTIQAFLKETKEYERSLLCSDPNEFETAFIEYLNFLEAYAAALNTKLVPSVSSDIINKSVVDSLAVINRSGTSKKMLKNAISSPDTFEHLNKLFEKNKEHIEQLGKAQESLEKES